MTVDLRARPRGALFACVVAGYLSCAGTAVADAPRGVADVVVAGGDADAAALLDAVHAPLGELGLEVRSGRAAEGASGPAVDVSPTPGHVQIWIDARDHERVAITVSTPERSSTRYVRRTESGAVLFEQVGFVVGSTVEVLLSEPPLAGPPPSAVQPPAREPAGPPAATDEARPPATPAKPSAFGLDMVATLSGSALGSSSLLGGGGALELAPWGRASLHPTFWVSGLFYAPQQATTDLVTLETSIVALRAGSDVALLHHGGLRLDVGAGAGADVVHAVPIEPGPPVAALAGPSTLLDAMLEGRLRVVLGAPRGPSAILALDLDYDLSPHRYDQIDRAGRVSSVLDPWRARPGILLGVSIPFVVGASP